MTVFSPRINRVAIVGGTHGNELIGVHLVKKFQQNPDLIARSLFESLALLANPLAIAAVRRYVDTDLNRCFDRGTLQKSEANLYEEQRARELYQTLVATEASKVDFLLDIHSTTANMGLTVILVNHHPFNLALTAHLVATHPAVKVYSAYQPGKMLTFLNSLCELGFAIEVGAIVQGTLQADLFFQTEALVYTILDYLEAYNQGHAANQNELTVYQHLKTIDYPKDNQGNLLGMIHPQLQGQDYQPLHPGDPIFITFNGQTLYYEGNSTVYPIFINEAAYYEKGIAFCLTEMRSLQLQELSR
ncbi:MAG: aspartoacylase [Leptolyngbyaceae cyanobacterium bins.302]|nr:aspartoacylase [Leptolyngbyaceae cyanobacterium bins.302]